MLCLTRNKRDIVYGAVVIFTMVSYRQCCEYKCDIVYFAVVDMMVTLLLLIPPVLCKSCCCNYDGVVFNAGVVFLSKQMRYYLSSWCHYDGVVVVVDTAGVV